MSTLQTDAAAGDVADARIDQVLAIMREVLAKPGLTADDEVMEYGGTSLSIVRILAQLRGELGVDVNVRDLAGTVTARSLVRHAR